MLNVHYTWVRWRMVPIKDDASGNPEIHYTSILKKYKQWVQNGSIQQIFYESVRHLNQQGALDLSVLHVDGTNIVAKLGSNHTGYSGQKYQKGNKIMAILDNEGNIIAPMTIAAVNQTDMTLLPNALSDLKTTCTACEIQIPEQTVLNLDAGFVSKKIARPFGTQSSNRISRRIHEIEKSPREGVNVSLTKHSMICASPAKEPLVPQNYASI